MSETSLFLAPGREDKSQQGEPSLIYERKLRGRGRLLVVLEERGSSLNHEESVLHRGFVKAWDIRQRDARILHRWMIVLHLHKMSVHASVFEHHYARVYVAYVGRIRSACQEI